MREKESGCGAKKVLEIVKMRAKKRDAYPLHERCQTTQKKEDENGEFSC